MRGPFTQGQMAQWYDFGYFQDDLDIAFGENSMFLPLHQYKEINYKQSALPLGMLNASTTLIGSQPISNPAFQSQMPQQPSFDYA